MDKNVKKSTLWLQLAAVVFLLAITMAGTLILFKYGDRALGEDHLLFTVLISFAALYAQVIIHEAGHLVFGLLTGYKFVSFRILSFIWIRKNGKIRFRRFSLAGTGGQCLLDPPDLVDGKIPVALYNLGGSLANVLTGLLCLGMCVAFAKIPYLSVAMLALGVYGMIFALSNGIPLHTGAVDNDGYNALSLGRSPDSLRALWIQLKINEQNSNDVRLKDMPEDWFALPGDREMKNNLIAAVGVFACNRLMDEHRFEEVDDLMAHLLEIDSGMAGVYRGLLICDRIYAELIGENRRDVIDGLLTKKQISFLKSMKNHPSVLRTQYAYALLYAGNSVGAGLFKTQFEKRAKSYPYPAEIQSERELIEIADSRASERKAISGS